MGKYISNYVRQIEFKMTLKADVIDIENYTDIGNISDSEIVIFDNNKKIRIKGKKLSIVKLLSNEVLITGNYNNITFEGKNE